MNICMYISIYHTGDRMCDQIGRDKLGNLPVGKGSNIGWPPRGGLFYQQPVRGVDTPQKMVSRVLIGCSPLTLNVISALFSQLSFRRGY